MKKEELIQLLNDMNLPSGERWENDRSGLVLYDVREQPRNVDPESLTVPSYGLMETDRPFRTADDETAAIPETQWLPATEEWFMEDTLSGEVISFSAQAGPREKTPPRLPRFRSESRLIDEFRSKTSQN